MKRITFIIALILSTFSMMAQELNYPIEYIDGQAVYKYTVQKGEGLYRIGINFGVTQEQIVQMNPQLQERGLRLGETIYIPVKKESTNADAYITHIIEPGETLYSLARRYGVKVADLQKLNPEVSKNMPVGATLLIRPKTAEEVAPVVAAAEPVAEVTPAEEPVVEDEFAEPVYVPSEVEPIIIHTDSLPEIPEIPEDSLDIVEWPLDSMQMDSLALVDTTHYDTIRLVYFLPLQADAVTNGDKVMESKIDRFLYFYQGAMLAIHEMQSEYQPFELFIYDTGVNDNHLDRILRTADSVIYRADAIIGPVDSMRTDQVAKYARKHQIPCMIPFAQRVDSIHTNPYLMQFNAPAPKGKKAVYFVGEEDGNWADFDMRLLNFFRRKPGAAGHVRYDLLGYDLTKYLIYAIRGVRQAQTAEEKQAVWEAEYIGLHTTLNFRKEEGGGYLNQPIKIVNRTADTDNKK